MDIPVFCTPIYNFNRTNLQSFDAVASGITYSDFSSQQNCAATLLDSEQETHAQDALHLDKNLNQLFKQKLFATRNHDRERAYKTLAAFCHHFKFYKTINIPKDAQRFLNIITTPEAFSAGHAEKIVLGAAFKAEVFDLMTCEIPNTWKEVLQLEYWMQAKIDSLKEIRWFLRRSRFKLWLCQQSLAHRQVLYTFKQELNYTIWALKVRRDIVKQARSSLRSDKHSLRSFATAIKPAVKKTWIYKALNPIRMFLKNLFKDTL